MYNLLMVGGGEYWDICNGLGEMDIERYLEYTIPSIRQRLEKPTPEVLDELKSSPVLFAYEVQNKRPARVGRLLEIRHRQTQLAFKFEFDPRFSPIPVEQFEALAWELDVQARFEQNRTHWAVKDVDLFEVLRRAGIGPPPPKPTSKPSIGRIPLAVRPKVFVVHGHHDLYKSEAARFLGQIELQPIILHEQPNGGRTIIEKFRDVAGTVEFAVVLLTADDVGGLPSGPAQPRARQNVIFELGYFIGKLGSEKVCALVQAGIEKPSDYDGVVYIDLDAAGAWKLGLMRELRQAGVAFDASNAL